VPRGAHQILQLLPRPLLVQGTGQHGTGHPVRLIHQREQKLLGPQVHGEQIIGRQHARRADEKVVLTCGVALRS